MNTIEDDMNECITKNESDTFNYPLWKFSITVGILCIITGIGLLIYMIISHINLITVVSMVVTGNPLFYLILGLLLIGMGFFDYYTGEKEGV